MNANTTVAARRAVPAIPTGRPFLVRFAGFGIRAPKQPIPGLDVAGRVVAVGSDVTRFRPGDRVFGIGTGTYAEYALAEQDELSHTPLADLEAGAVRGKAVVRIGGAA